MKIFFTFIVFILLSLAGIPYADGYLFKDQISRSLEALSDDTNVKLQLANYQLGYLQSIATIQISDPKNPNISGSIECNITHGPIVKDKTSQYTTAYGAMNCSRDLLNSQMATALGGNIHINIYALKTFDHKWITQTEIPAFNLQQPGVSIKWQGLNIDSTFSLIEHKITSFDLKIQQNGATIDSDIVKLAMQPMTYVSQSELQPSDLWSGNDNFKLDSLSLRLFSTGFDANQLNSTTKYNSDNANLFSIDSTANIKDLTIAASVPLPALNTIKSTLNIQGINTKPIKEFKEISKNLQSRPATQEEKQKMRLLMPHLFTSKTMLDFNLSFNTELGAFLSSAKLTMAPGLPSEPTDKDVEKHIQSAVSVRVAQALFNKIASIVAPPPPPPSAPTPTELAAAKTAATEVAIAPLENTVVAAMRDNKIPANVAMQITDIAKQQLPLDQFAAKLDQLPVPKDINQQIKTQYQTMLATISQLLPAPTPTAPPVDPAQAMIDRLLQQGIIVKDNTDYTSTVILENGVAKVNGKAM